MFTTHLIPTEFPFDISKLNNFVSKIYRAAYAELDNGGYFYWIEGKSAQGLAVYCYESHIEIENKALSNIQDYQLTNKIVEEIIRTTEADIYNESQKTIKGSVIWNNRKIIQAQARDFKNIRALTAGKEPIVIEGPRRKVHFGNRLHEEYKGLNDMQFKNKLFDLILKVNYKIPDFHYGDFMEFFKDEKLLYRMQILTNEQDCLTAKHDYILLQSALFDPIMITYENFNTMLPSNWTLVDEFTVVAPIADQTEWNTLLLKAKQFDLWDSYFKK